MEHLVLVWLRLRPAQDVNDNSVAATRSALLQYVVLGGSGSVHQLQLLVPMQRRYPHRRSQVRQTLGIQQRRAVVLIQIFTLQG